jgi:glycosyltransferase involved in cell wall biosynthesis
MVRSFPFYDSRTYGSINYPPNYFLVEKVMTKKRIAFVANTSWYIYNLRIGVIRALQAEGYEIVSIAPTDSYTHYLISEGIEHHNIPMDNKGRNLFKDVGYLWRLARMYRTLNIDFIFHYTIKPNIYGSLAARWNRLPSVSVVSGAGYTFTRRNNWLYDISILLYRIAMTFTKETWFVNRDDLAEFLDEKIVRVEKTKLLPGEGIDTVHFSPQPSSKSDDSIRFLLSARLIWDKGVGEYVAAARRIRQEFPNTSFELLGFLDVENPTAIPSEQIYHWQREGSIQYLGKTEDVRPYVAACDCFVLPSYYREGTPRSLLEAAAMAKPIITTDNVGCREVVRSGDNGFLCACRSVDDLVDKMRQMILLTPEERKQMGKNGRQYIVEHFDEALVIEYYLKVLHRHYLQPNTSPV